MRNPWKPRALTRVTLLALLVSLGSGRSALAKDLEALTAIVVPAYTAMNYAVI
jgi:hypothetical protein